MEEVTPSISARKWEAHDLVWMEKNASWNKKVIPRNYGHRQKLAKFLAESGDHVKAGQAFAEVEVMKMYMPLIAEENGIVQLIKQVRAQLEAGVGPSPLT